ncbi:MAG: hypothetical protein GX649_09090 [Chloroflexi bacterium]|nr:hypothetical protein [Chloroflexota bacterium]
MAPSTQDIIAYVGGLAGHGLNRDEGVKHGEPDRAVDGVLVCWMATRQALETAAREGCDLVLTHESLYYPYNATDRDDNPPGWEEWPTNRGRREVLERHDLTLLRVHGSLDEVAIYDDFAALLGLGEPAQADALARVYDVAPCTVADLVARVKRCTGLGAVRVSAPRGMEQVVRRVGLPWGGLGLFVNVGYQQRLVEMGCDAMIAGESDDYGMRFGADLGIPLIETGHSVSENPGLRRFADMLAARFPGLRVVYHECPPAWEIV